MTGYIYFLHDTARNAIKIGYSTDVEKRFKEFCTANVSIRVIRKITGTIKEEKLLHRVFAAQNIAGEWFDISVDDVWKIEETLALAKDGKIETGKAKRKERVAFVSETESEIINRISALEQSVSYEKRQIETSRSMIADCWAMIDDMKTKRPDLFKRN